MHEETVIDRFFGSLQTCDLAVLRDCLTDDAVVWHSFDRIEMRPDDVAKSWEAMAARFTERGVADVRCQPTPTGYVQQHLFVVRNADGSRKAWPVCLVVRINDGRIARLDEYIDLSGGFDPGEGDVLTPGLG
jgi:ketosteroid isomerase-like protein